jgi:hypothetical protein
LFGLVLFLFSLPACQKDKNMVGSEDAQSGVVTVVGEVTAIDDRVPDDGGVTIDLKIENGDTMLLSFESFQVIPDENRRELYEVIKQVEVGSRVRATGLRKGHWIEIGQLSILETD